MKKLILLIVLLFAFSCERKSSIQESKKEYKNDVLSVHDGPDEIYSISVEKIDSCEYVIVRRHNALSIIHKANCENHK